MNRHQLPNVPLKNSIYRRNHTCSRGCLSRTANCLLRNYSHPTIHGSGQVCWSPAHKAQKPESGLHIITLTSSDKLYSTLPQLTQLLSPTTLIHLEWKMFKSCISLLKTMKHNLWILISLVWRWEPCKCGIKGQQHVFERQINRQPESLHGCKDRNQIL